MDALRNVSVDRSWDFIEKKRKNKKVTITTSHDLLTSGRGVKNWGIHTGTVRQGRQSMMKDWDKFVQHLIKLAVLSCRAKMCCPIDLKTSRIDLI